MAKHFIVSDSLADVHWIPFHRLLERPSTSVSMAHAWLAERGYRLEHLHLIHSALQTFALAPGVDGP
jgi:hypothetical protein